MSNIIKCPRCGREYHFQEIFMPKTIFQKVSHIVRDSNGKICDVIGEDAPMEETYFCDLCDAPLIVGVDLAFGVKIDSTIDFTRNAVTVVK